MYQKNGPLSETKVQEPISENAEPYIVQASTRILKESRSKQRKNTQQDYNFQPTREITPPHMPTHQKHETLKSTLTEILIASVFFILKLISLKSRILQRKNTTMPEYGCRIPTCKKLSTNRKKTTSPNNLPPPDLKSLDQLGKAI